MQFGIAEIMQTNSSAIMRGMPHVEPSITQPSTTYNNQTEPTARLRSLAIEQRSEPGVGTICIPIYRLKPAVNYQLRSRATPTRSSITADRKI